MKKLSLILFMLAVTVTVAAAKKKQDVGIVYSDALNYTMVGKLFNDTPNPYHRIDVDRFPGFEKVEVEEMISGSGLAIAFKTDSKRIFVKPEYGFVNRPINGSDISYAGFDLYIRQNGKWIWAGQGVNKEALAADPVRIVLNMDGSMHDCLLYLPIYSELKSLEIGVDQGSTIESIPNPFKCRIGIYGSSYTQGISTTRAGMAYPAQLSRATGYQLLSIAASGRCKMQPYFLDAICASDFDAFIFDTFSNPPADMIIERLEPFIRKIRQYHPTEPLIFQQTIRREWCNFNTVTVMSERSKVNVADSLMKIMCKKYPNVYFIHPNASSPDHECTVDGTHPDNHGYTLWMQSIKDPVVKILRKHGIK